ncbi:MAG: sugar phosphate isomerase/epimerase [Deltaproteobacteria bacterium]|nr:sugar phosphate isomerase/epimerase [Deltaproteobacteria bacterium]
MFDRLFVHTPYHFLKDSLDETLVNLVKFKLAPEIYFSALNLEELALDRRPLEQAAARLAEQGLPCSFHGPFLDLSPAGYDPRIVAVTRERFQALFALARICKPEVIVLHSGYERWRFNLNINLWLEQSLAFWRPLLSQVEDLGTVLAIENIFETTPGGLRMLFDEIASPVFGGCFDIGHWHLFGEMDLSEWLGLLKKHIIAFHLHDNRGRFDDHMVPGDGLINFAALKSLARSHNIKALVHTFELHQRSQLQRGVEWFKNNNLWVSTTDGI